MQTRADISITVLYVGIMANGTAAGGQLTTTTNVANFPYPVTELGTTLTSVKGVFAVGHV